MGCVICNMRELGRRGGGAWGGGVEGAGVSGHGQCTPEILNLSLSF